MSYQLLCDLCGKPILAGHRRFKFKELKSLFHETWWERIDAHDICVQAVISAYRAQKEKEKLQGGT